MAGTFNVTEIEELGSTIRYSGSKKDGTNEVKFSWYIDGGRASLYINEVYITDFSSLHIVTNQCPLHTELELWHGINKVANLELRTRDVEVIA